MSLGEFDFIDRYLQSKAHYNKEVIIGIGDDAAIVKAPTGKQLVLAIDTIVNGIHFLEDSKPEDIAYRALAVNLSDMAAMAAQPKWIMVSLTVPEMNETWLALFCDSLFKTCHDYQCALIGGDLTHGPLQVTVSIQGLVHSDKYLTRSGAQVGDLIYVTGELGTAAYALNLIRQSLDVPKAIMQRFLRPTPRVNEGMALGKLATAAIDISDGFAQDLNHILKVSGVGATVYANQLPVNNFIKNKLSRQDYYRLALTGGDDYELIAIVPASLQSQLEALDKQFDCGFTQIGIIEEKTGLRCVDENNHEIILSHLGYQHFE